MQAWKISRFAEVDKEWWLLLSIFFIAALLNSFGGLNNMLLFLYVLPTLFSAYFFGQRHAVLTAFASVFLVVAGVFLKQYVIAPQANSALSMSAWYQIGAWAGILVLCGYATGRLFREMHESYRGILLMVRYFLREEEAHEQVRRIANYSAAIAQERGMNRDEVEIVRAAALLRDLGALNISPEILEKTARLTSNVQLENGTAYADEDLIRLRKVMPIVISQMKKEKEKPDATKVIDVASEFESLVSGTNGKPVHPEVARSLIARAAGGRFDEDSVAAFEAAFERGALNRRSEVHAERGVV